MLKLEDTMTKSTIEEYIKTIVNYSNKTSYKFYLLLAILELGQQFDELSFRECGREMIVQSWNDISNTDFYYSSTDKLRDIKNDIVFKEGLLEFASENTIRQSLNTCENEKINSYYDYLTQYCTYLLISYGQWNTVLKKEKNYHKIHRLIADLSQSESCLYEIHDKTLILNSEYFDVINKDTDYFKKIVKEELRHYLSKKK